jgi:hypothetical protein
MHEIKIRRKMKKLGLSCLWGRLIALAVLLCSSSGNAAIIQAAVSVTSAAGGNITGTSLANNKSNGNRGNCTSQFSPGSCTTTTSSSSLCNRSVSTTNSHIWILGTFAVAPGTHSYHVTIDNTVTTAGSLNKLLCPSGTVACQVCICSGAGNTETLLNGQACTASSGEINPTCSGGRVQSVTSSLTLTCP